MIPHRWINHPLRSDMALSFTPSSINTHRWSDLRQLSTWCFDSSTNPFEYPDESAGSIRPRQDSLGKMLSPPIIEEIIEDAFCTHSGNEIILSIAQKGGLRKQKPRVFIVSLGATGDHTSSGEKERFNLIPIPADICATIEKPLNVLPRDSFVFLDRSFWICTWRLGSSSPSGNLTTGSVMRHFFLPRAWVNAESLRSIQILADGTVLCPRRGEVAVIRSNLGADW